MGFSVSGAAAIIFATMFVTFGMWYTASANSFEAVSEAEKERTDTVVETCNTDVEIVSTSYDGTNNEVTVNNTGASQLTINSTDLLVDGEYQTGWRDGAQINDGSDPGPRLWLPGEQLTITVAADTEPDWVKVAVKNGVSDTSGVPA